MFLAGAVHLCSRLNMNSTGYHHGSSPKARVVGLLASLAFCIAAYAWTKPRGDDLSHYTGLGFRGVLVMLTVEGTAAILFTALGWVTSVITGVIRRMWKVVSRLFRSIASVRLFRRRRAYAPPPPAPPPTFNERIEQAKRDFAAKCETLQAAGLDEDELELALLTERQKYVRRLQEIVSHEVP